MVVRDGGGGGIQEVGMMCYDIGMQDCWNVFVALCKSMKSLLWVLGLGIKQ